MARVLFRDYETYLQSQVETNARKIDNVFAGRDELAAVAQDVVATLEPVRGICHGSRNGWEVRTLRSFLGCDVFGTDIAPTAGKYGLIQHDFHVLPDVWKNRFCFVYSNSLDHAHDPATALRHWALSLRPGGRMYIAHSRNSLKPQNLADCFGATLEEYEQLVGKACTHVKTIWLGDRRNADGGKVKSLAIVVGERSVH